MSTSLRSLAFGALVLGSCAGPARSPQTSSSVSVTPDLPVSHPPFDQAYVSWKQRLDQPYVYVEHLGSYTETGALLPMLFSELERQGLDAAGPPFGLYYDDPGRVPVAELRSRMCVPVSSARDPGKPLAYDVLPSTTVVYAFASGPYPELARAYPALYGYMSRMGWVENGPLREVYLVSPASVQNYEELLAEIQIPATTGR